MKKILERLASLFGLVPSSRYAALRRAADELRTGSKAWEKKASRLTAQVEKAEAELKRHVQLLRKARADVERLREREAEFDTIHRQLTETERALAVAREQLMAVEVKMDILEGAANVLDARTRSAIQRHPDKTSAAV